MSLYEVFLIIIGSAGLAQLTCFALDYYWGISKQTMLPLSILASLWGFMGLTVGLLGMPGLVVGPVFIGLFIHICIFMGSRA